jgi:hypothetical protein
VLKQHRAHALTLGHGTGAVAGDHSFKRLKEGCLFEPHTVARDTGESLLEDDELEEGAAGQRATLWIRFSPDRRRDAIAWYSNASIHALMDGASHLRPRASLSGHTSRTP